MLALVMWSLSSEPPFWKAQCSPASLSCIFGQHDPHLQPLPLGRRLGQLQFLRHHPHDTCYVMSQVCSDALALGPLLLHHSLQPLAI